MMKINRILKKVLIYSWKASPKTFVLLVIVSSIFCLLKFMEIAILEGLIESVNDVYKGQGLQVFMPYLLGLTGILLVSPIIELFEFLVKGYFWRRGHGYMQALFHGTMAKKDLIDFENSQEFDQMEKAGLGTSETPNNIRIIIQMLFLYLPFFILVAYYLLTIQPILVVVLLLIFIPLLIAEIFKMKDHYDFENGVANARRRMAYYEGCMVDKTHFKETLQNDAYDFFYSKLMVTIDDFTNKHKKVYMRALKMDTIMHGLNLLGYMGIMALLVVFLARGAISIGEFAGVYYAVDRMTHMLKRMIADIGSVMKEMATSSFFIDFLSYDEEAGKADTVDKKCDIHLENLTFSYPNTKKAAVSNLNLVIPHGTSLAIVGENGSGKTSLSKLILGLYQPDQGRVLYGNVNIHDHKPSSRYDKVSAVFQDFTKYKLGVRENVKISHVASRSDIKGALNKSHFNYHKLVHKEETVLSKDFGGQDLSGGEWQRLAIARGFYRQHDIIVLDEPTAAIDPIEEEHVFKTFQEASQGKTSILVSHRLGSVKLADHILVMDQGCLVEQGTHEELLTLRGKYHQLFMAQAKWYKRNDTYEMTETT